MPLSVMGLPSHQIAQISTQKPAVSGELSTSSSPLVTLADVHYPDNVAVTSVGGSGSVMIRIGRFYL